MGEGQEVNVPLYLRSVVANYQISKIGSEGFNWECGNWGDMPCMIVEAFMELSSGISEGLELVRKRRDSKNNKTDMRKPFSHAS